MQFEINGDKITITGVDGEFDSGQFSRLFVLVDRANHEFQHQLKLTRFRDVMIPAGMAYLDDHYPDHVQRVDLDRLDLRRSDLCVLAQASGMSFWDAQELLPRTDSGWRAYDMGFEVYTATHGVTVTEATQLWVEAYQARRQGDQDLAS